MKWNVWVAPFLLGPSLVSGGGPLHQAWIFQYHYGQSSTVSSSDNCLSLAKGLHRV